MVDLDGLSFFNQSLLYIYTHCIYFAAFYLYFSLHGGLDLVTENEVKMPHAAGFNQSVSKWITIAVILCCRKRLDKDAIVVSKFTN